MENKYLLDSNIIIEMWRDNPKVIYKLLENNSVIILEEVLSEISKKEKRKFKGIEVLSERFMKLVPQMIEVKKDNLKDFCDKIDIKATAKGKYYYKSYKISYTDLLQIFTCYFDEMYILVTNDKNLLYSSKEIIGDKRVLNLTELLSDEISVD